MIKAVLLLTLLLSSQPAVPDIDIQVGKASWYGYNDGSGLYTASGAKFNPEALTAASWDYKFGEEIYVFCPATMKSVKVKINDTGNFDLYGRKIDLSAGAFRELAPLSIGEIEVILINGG